MSQNKRGDEKIAENSLKLSFIIHWNLISIVHFSVYNFSSSVFQLCLTVILKFSLILLEICVCKFIVTGILYCQIDALQRSLNDARENSGRLSSTIESLMTSHAELQEAMERLQTDMGQKESELNILRKDKWVL